MLFRKSTAVEPKEEPQQETQAPPQQDRQVEQKPAKERIAGLREIAKELHARAKPALERYRRMERERLHRVNAVEGRIQDVERDRKRLVAKGQDPDEMLRELHAERAKVEQQLEEAEQAYFDILDDTHERYITEAESTSRALRQQWQAAQPELLDLLGRFDGVIEEIGLPSEDLRVLVSSFSDELERWNQVIGVGRRPRMKRISVPTLVKRDAVWSEMKQVLSDLRVWLTGNAKAAERVRPFIKRPS